MNLPFSKNKDGEEKPKKEKKEKVKKEKKAKEPKPKKEKKDKKSKDPKDKKGKEEKAKNKKAKDEGKNTEPEQEGQEVVKKKKKLSKLAVIVTVAVIAIIIIAVVVIIIFFPKKNPDKIPEDISSSQVEEESSGKEDDKDKSGSESGENGEESSQILSPDGIPMIPDPDYNLMSVDEALDVINKQFDTDKYEVETIDEKILINGKTYSAFVLSEDGEQIGSPIAVDRESGEYMCYYPDEVFSDILDFPLIPADAAGYKWNGSFERKDANGNITSILTVKQLDPDKMHFAISSYVGTQSETLTGIAKTKDHVAVFTDGDYFRIEFVMFDDGVTLTESGRKKHEINATFDGKYQVK